MPTFSATPRNVPLKPSGKPLLGLAVKDLNETRATRADLRLFYCRLRCPSAAANSVQTLGLLQRTCAHSGIPDWHLIDDQVIEGVLGTASSDTIATGAHSLASTHVTQALGKILLVADVQPDDLQVASIAGTYLSTPSQSKGWLSRSNVPRNWLPSCSDAMQRETRVMKQIVPNCLQDVQPQRASALQLYEAAPCA